MDNELMLDVGQANELKLAFRKAGWKNEDIKKLCEGKMSEQVLFVVRGQAELGYFVNCDSDPVTIESCFLVEEHKKMGEMRVELRTGESYAEGGELYLNGKKMLLHQMPHERSREGLQDELRGEEALTVTIAKYLRDHPHLIPESWKAAKGGIAFFGTVYRFPKIFQGRTVYDYAVPMLQWQWGHFCLSYTFLDPVWGSWSHPAAILAS